MCWTRPHNPVQYLGGKARQGSQIGPFITKLIALDPMVDYWEPFVGSGGVMSRVQHPGPGVRHASDFSKDLIDLWKAVVDGWVPPLEVTHEEWKEYKKDPNPSLERTFAGFGASMLGSWFLAYVKLRGAGTDSSIIAGASRSLVRKAKLCADVQWDVCDYRDIKPKTNDIVYCDPPYGPDTRFWGYEKKFNFQTFLDWCKWQRERGVRLYISGYVIPEGWKPVLDVTRRYETGPPSKGIRFERGGMQPEYLMRPKKPGE